MAWSIPAPAVPAALKAKLAEPLTELTAHFVLSIVAALFLKLTELLVTWLGISNRPIPIFHVSFEEFYFDLDVFGIGGIIAVGIIKAVVALSRTK